MLINERESPRAKIRSWLIETDSTARSKPIQTHTAYPKSKFTAQPGSSPPLRVKKGEHRAIFCGTFMSPVSSRQCTTYNKPSISAEHQFMKEPGERSKHHIEYIADHSTSRRMLSKHGYDAQLTNKFSQPRKRQRTRLSTSSDLRPASVIEAENHQHTKGDVDDNQGTQRPRHLTEANSAADLLESPNHSPLFCRPPKQSANPYERRSRHKTHEDRYDMKSSIVKQTKMPVRPGKEKKTAKATRQKVKSGQALIQHYTAPNVSSDRLTLRSRKTAGFFSRGKASSPVKRRGLPDLAFSELAFLNTGRYKWDETTKNTGKEETKRAKKAKKATDVEAEISRYFIAGKGGKADVAEAASDHQNRTKRQRRLHEPVTPMIPGLEQSFLGFGTSGGNSSPPVTFVKELDARCVSPMSQRDTRSSRRSTSYFTWSRSSAPRFDPNDRSESSRAEQRQSPQMTLCSTESKSLNGDTQVCESDSLAAFPNEETLGATAALSLTDDVDNVSAFVSEQGRSPHIQNDISCPVLEDIERMQRSPDNQSPALNHSLASKAIQSGDPSKGSANIRGRISSGSGAKMRLAKPVAVLSPQPFANQETFNAIQSTLNSLLEVCSAKFPTTVTADTTSERRPEFIERSSITREQLDRNQYFPSHAIRKTANFQTPIPEDHLEPVAQPPDVNPRNDVERFEYSDQHEQVLPKLTSALPLPPNNVYRRPHTTAGVCLQNPYAQTPPIDSPEILRDYEAFHERQLESKTRTFDTEDSNHGNYDGFDTQRRLQNFEDADFMHTYSPLDDRRSVQGLEDEWLGNNAQPELATRQAIHPKPSNTDERSRPSLESTSAKFFAEYYHPDQSQMSSMEEGLDFHADDDPQRGRFSRGLANSPFIALTPPPTRALQTDSIQTRSTSRTYDDLCVEPVGFWKPNRLY